jgi:thymidylate synthase (FAD)
MVGMNPLVATSQKSLCSTSQSLMNGVRRHTTVKQGSGAPVSKDTGVIATKLLQAHAQKSLELYDEAMERGISPEQARMFLPAYSMYVRWRWTASLNAILSFLELRQGETAQDEITQYANAVAEFVQGQYPITMEAWNAR